jgi:hypothetical protein
VSVPAQIAMLLALNAALVRRCAAGPAWTQPSGPCAGAADALPDDLRLRLADADRLSDTDRERFTEARAGA